MKQAHFVTGATGFLGAMLVLELLRRTDDDIVALVRPGDLGAIERFHQSIHHAEPGERRALMEACQPGFAALAELYSAEVAT